MILRFGRITFKPANLVLKKQWAKPFLICSLLVTICWPVNVFAQTGRSSDRDIDARTRQQVIEEIIRQLRRRYVLPAAVDKIEEHLRKKLRAGSYDNAATAVKFAQALTEDLREVGDDLHFDVSHNPEREQTLIAAGTGTKAKLPDIPLSAEERERLRETNYGFGEVKVMLGNVGYLELSSFVDLKYSKSTAVAAMGFLANTDALIVDLRRNNGGSGSLVGFLIDYFFGPEPVELMSSYDRETNTTTRHKTSKKIPGIRLPKVDVYVLTSRNTGSAAEAFAFTLQQVGRGKTVGDRTAGAAHGGGWVPIGQGFIIFIPTFRGFNPRTGKSWNNVGVQPDVPARGDRSIEVAHWEAVKGLLAKATTDSQKQGLNWVLPLLELRAFGQKNVPTARLDDYPARYEGVTISLVQGQLSFLGASGIRRNLLALADDYFLVEDLTVPPENQARIRFVRNAEGKIIELQLMVRDGRVFRRPRQ
jgi:retinol-binding protein 3